MCMNAATPIILFYFIFLYMLIKYCEEINLSRRLEEVNNKVSFSRYIVNRPYCFLPAVTIGRNDFIQTTFK